jgi:hypothetical protein
MSDNGRIESHEYWAEIEALAKSVSEEARKYRRDIHDALHDTIDGHQWVIYPAYHFDVLRHSPNDEAYFDEMGTGFPDAACLSDITTPLVFYALMEDVRQHSAFTEEDEEPEEEDEEPEEEDEEPEEEDDSSGE